MSTSGNDPDIGAKRLYFNLTVIVNLHTQSLIEYRQFSQNMTHSVPERWLIFQNWTGPSATACQRNKCGLLICSGNREVHDPPVLLALGGELVVKCCGAAVDPIGCGGAVVLYQSAVWQVQHGAPLEGLQVRCGNEAWDGQRILTELHTNKKEKKYLDN